MDNQLEIIHIFKLEHYSLRFDIACELKHKSVYIEYKCLWNKNEDYYDPINIQLIKIWRDADKTDQENEKISWSADELSDDWYSYFNSGLKLHADSLSLSINLA